MPAPDAGADATSSEDVSTPADAPPEEAEGGSGCCRGTSSCGGGCADGPAHLYRGEGDALDCVGSENATQSNAGFGSGREGQSFTFGGGDARPQQYVTLPPALLDFGAEDFTVSLWFRSTLHGNLISKRASCWGGRAFTGLDLRLTSEGVLLFEVWTLSDSYLHRAGVGLNDGAWHHVAIVRRGETMDLLVDGASIATGPMVGELRDPSRTPVYLGVGRCVAGAPGSNGNADGSTWLDGSLDEVAVLHRAMSAAEVRAVATGRCAL